MKLVVFGATGKTSLEFVKQTRDQGHINTRREHEKQEVLVKESDLDWTIMRPSGLTDDPLTESYAIGENIQTNNSRFARADVAHAIIKEINENTFVYMGVTVTN